MWFGSDTFGCGFLGTALAFLDLLQVQHSADPAKIPGQLAGRHGRKLFGPVAAFRKRLGRAPRHWNPGRHVIRRYCFLDFLHAMDLAHRRANHAQCIVSHDCKAEYKQRRLWVTETFAASLTHSYWIESLMGV